MKRKAFRRHIFISCLNGLINGPFTKDFNTRISCFCQEMLQKICVIGGVMMVDGHNDELYKKIQSEEINIQKMKHRKLSLGIGTERKKTMQYVSGVLILVIDAEAVPQGLGTASKTEENGSTL